MLGDRRLTTDRALHGSTADVPGPIDAFSTSPIQASRGQPRYGECPPLAGAGVSER